MFTDATINVSVKTSGVVPCVKELLTYLKCYLLVSHVCLYSLYKRLSTLRRHTKYIFFMKPAQYKDMVICTK